MPRLTQFLARALVRLAALLDRNLTGVTAFPPGSYYSPLLDIEALEDNPRALHDAAAHNWAGIDLRIEAQQARLEHFLANPTGLPLQPEPDTKWRYYSRNDFFLFADAFALSQMLAQLRPKRVVEIGSGFSSAVMLDTRDHLQMPLQLTFIEPFPERLETLLRPSDRISARIIVEPVQQVATDVFTALEAGDFLFIDSSHVAKIGSDVADIFARVLPALQRGVYVHFHDIFYPHAYPLQWLRQGHAWNEVLFLQTFLRFNSAFQVEWFNAFAGVQFRERLATSCPRFLEDTGGSLWLQRIA